MRHFTLSVPDIDCEHCEHAITEALTPVKGVIAVQVDIPRKTVQLDLDEASITVDKVKEILAEEDYPVAAVS